MRSGARAGSRTVVVHLRARTETAIIGGPRFGLVVSKQVGNAVARHSLSRKLRHVCFAARGDLDRSYDIVVRALPPAAAATCAELADDVSSCIDRARRKLPVTPGPELR